MTVDGRLLSILIKGSRFPANTETKLQEQISGLLGRLRVAHRREVRLNEHDRPDFMAAGIAIEVKIAGSKTEVLTQLHRYAQCAEVNELILVTTRARHLDMPTHLNGKPLFVASLLDGAF